MNPLRWPPPPKRGRRRIYSSLPVMIRGDRDPSLSSRRCWDFCLLPAMPPLSRKTDLLIVTVENYCPLSFPSVSFRFLLSLGVSDQKRIEAAAFGGGSKGSLPQCPTLRLSIRAGEIVLCCDGLSARTKKRQKIFPKMEPAKPKSKGSLSNQSAKFGGPKKAS